jgi:hypothetical protein
MADAKRGAGRPAGRVRPTSLGPDDISPLPSESPEAFALRRRLLAELPTWEELQAKADGLAADDIEAMGGRDS